MGVEDLYSRFLVLIPLKVKTAPAVVTAFLNSWISTIGVPRHIHSNLGGEFRNQLFSELCTALEVEHSFAPAAVHQSVIIERAWKMIEEMFRNLPEKMKRFSWPFMFGL